jgi:uncharacterized protein YndB with AHSA1/START domain
MTEVPATRSLVFERFLAHPPEKVWRALTDGRLLGGWLMPNDFQPIVGHRFSVQAAPRPGWNGMTTCEVLAIEPLKHLAYTWNTSRDGETNTLETTVTWTLETVEGGTRVRMEQSGFRTTEVHAHEGASQAWPLFFDNLERLLAESLEPSDTPRPSKPHAVP